MSSTKPRTPQPAPRVPRAETVPVLVLRPAGDSSTLAAPCTALDWADAQQEGRHLVARFRRILALPAAFPPEVHEHEREALCVALRRCIERGGLGIFLVPESDLPASTPDVAWNRARFVLERVTGLRLNRVGAGHPGPFHVEPTVAPEVAAHLETHRAQWTLDLEAGPLGTPVCPDPTRVLAGYGKPVDEPSVVAGFPGQGAWMLLPWPRGGATPGEIEALLPLLDTLQSVLRAHLEQEARRLRQLADLSLPPDPEPTGRRRRAARAATEVPYRSLPPGCLHACPQREGVGFLQWQPDATSRPQTSSALRRGAWAIATTLLAAENFRDSGRDTLDLEALYEALDDAGVPRGKRSSLRKYVSEAHQAIRSVLGKALPPQAIHIRRGAESISIAGLRRALRAGGAKVQPLQGDTP